MKQRLFIVLVLVFLVALLALLNAATYVQKEKVADTELAPNRSTFNAGTTGTQAFYTLLSETGRNVTRWQTTLDTIASDTTKNRPSVFVMIGPFRNELTEVETTELMRWVSAGGTLILIDREPSSDLALTTAQWQMDVAPAASEDIFNVDASNQRQMTASTPAHKPVLPSAFSHKVSAVQPSRFASSIRLERFAQQAAGTGSGTGAGYYKRYESTATPEPSPYDFSTGGEAPPPPANYSPEPDEMESDEAVDDAEEAAVFEPAFEAPLVHLAGGGRNLLVEAPFAAGRVIILTDPYIVSNAGISIVDNARLAVNLVTSREGLIAFDEYHHGYGANNNRFFQYFEGTPIIALFLQFGLIVALVFYSQSRRFARAVPEKQQSRLSKLEYVSAMAELQQRTKAYDLAIENIYADFRRRVCAVVGLDNTIASRSEIAARIAERVGGSPRDIQEVMYLCEEVIRGEPIGKKDTVALVDKLRHIESQLGLRRAGRGS